MIDQDQQRDHAEERYLARYCPECDESHLGESRRCPVAETAEDGTDGAVVAADGLADTPRCDGPGPSGVCVDDWAVWISPGALAGLGRAEVLERLRVWIAEVTR